MTTVDYWPNHGGELERVAVERVLDSGVYYNGKETEALEAEFGKYVGLPSSHVVATSSCTHGLHAALALRVAYNDRVVLPAYTFVGTLSGVFYLRAIPRFADVDIALHNVTAATLNRVIDKSVKAVIVVHIHGAPAPIDEIAVMCERRGIFLIEDCCQAHGATHKGRHVGTFGNVGVFSFHEAKNMPAGQGGIAVFRSATDADRFRELIGYGRQSYEEGRGNLYHEAAYSYKITEFAAAVARARLQMLPGVLDVVRYNYKVLINGLYDVPGVHVQAVPHGADPAWHKCRVRFTEGFWGRTPPYVALSTAGILVDDWMNTPLLLHPMFTKEGMPGDGQYMDAEFLLRNSVIVGNERYPVLIDTSAVKEFISVVRKQAGVG